MNAPLTVIPMDPVDVEQLPPADLEACANCRGTGAVWDGRDPQTADACAVCLGEGILPEYLGGAA